MLFGGRLADDAIQQLDGERVHLTRVAQHRERVLSDLDSLRTLTWVAKPRIGNRVEVAFDLSVCTRMTEFPPFLRVHRRPPRNPVIGIKGGEDAN